MSFLMFPLIIAVLIVTSDCQFSLNNAYFCYYCREQLIPFELNLQVLVGDRDDDSCEDSDAMIAVMITF